MIPQKARVPLVVAALVLLALIAAQQIEHAEPAPGRALQSNPERVMGTSCRLIAVPKEAPGTSDSSPEAARALQAAEAVLRKVEAQMSTFIEASAVSRLNRAPAGKSIALPSILLEVLRKSRKLYDDTQGAFDITCDPVIELWRAAGKSKKLPDRAAVDIARQASTWKGLELGKDHVTKQAQSVRVDLGGIAKGYAIDHAVIAMRDAGMAGGLVDVGGDLRVFGKPPQGDRWEVMVKSPVSKGTIVTLTLKEGAVCTSGNYFRFVEIEGKRFSHIIDPRSGQPVADVASATVLAPDATTADGWATALSVLGESGLELLPKQAEAMLIVGSQDAPRALLTPGLKAAIAAGPPYPTTVTERR